MRQQTPVVKPKVKRSPKGRIKSSTVAIYSSVFVLLMSVIAVGYRAPEQTIVSTANVANISTAEEDLAVSDVVATDIAASVAQAASLAVEPNIVQRAVSARIQSTYQVAGSDTSVINKPAIVELSEATRNITTYTVVEGDTVDSIAAKFGISAQTLKWANSLTGNSVAVGSTVDILPANGISYIAKDGDTIEKIAEKYKADVAYITSYNDLELSGLRTGLKILIPGGELPETERPGYVAPYSARTPSFMPGSVGNRYAPGNCTWHVYERRLAVGKPVGSFLGDAKYWVSYAVKGKPSIGAVLVDTQGYYGHVAFVENILADGSVILSEMNNSAYGGFNIVNSRTLTPGQAALYWYIH